MRHNTISSAARCSRIRPQTTVHVADLIFTPPVPQVQPAPTIVLSVPDTLPAEALQRFSPDILRRLNERNIQIVGARQLPSGYGGTANRLDTDWNRDGWLVQVYDKQYTLTCQQVCLLAHNRLDLSCVESCTRILL